MSLLGNNRELVAFQVFRSKIETETELAIDQLRCDVKKSRRIVHNLRGGAGFFGLDELAALGCEIEGMLEDLIEKQDSELNIYEDEELVEKVRLATKRLKHFRKLAIKV